MLPSLWLRRMGGSEGQRVMRRLVSADAEPIESLVKSNARNFWSILVLSECGLVGVERPVVWELGHDVTCHIDVCRAKGTVHMASGGELSARSMGPNRIGFDVSE